MGPFDVDASVFSHFIGFATLTMSEPNLSYKHEFEYKIKSNCYVLTKELFLDSRLSISLDWIGCLKSWVVY